MAGRAMSGWLATCDSNSKASPATGLASRHKAEQQALVNEALNIEG